MPYTKTDLETLILNIQSATGLTISEIEEKAGYHSTYLSAIKSRKPKNIPPNIIDRLREVFKKDLEIMIAKERASYLTYENSLKILAYSEIYGYLIIEILAYLRSQSAVNLAEEVKVLVERRLQMLRDELHNT